MMGLTCSDFLIILVAVLLSSAKLSNAGDSDDVADRCVLELLKSLSSVTVKGNIHLPQLGQRTELSFHFKATCRPFIAYEILDEENNNAYTNLNQYRITKRLSYETSYTHVAEDEYKTTLIIDAFRVEYAGVYKCIVRDASDMNTKLEIAFQVHAPILEPEDPLPCFLPHAENITANTSSPSGKIELKWELTTKEDSKLSYCKGSRRWKVRMLKFPKVAAAPGDNFVIEDSTVEWITVPRRDTNYTFTDITLGMYYSFQIGHLEKKFSSSANDEIGPQVYASKVYYLGNQIPANIRKPPNSIVRLPYGSTSSIHCDARGLPAPNVKWIKESSSNSVPTVRLNNSAVLELNHVTEDDAGIYYCLAFNTLVNPPKGRRNEADTWQITVIIEEYDTTETGLSCRSLSIDSSICKSYIHTDLQRIFTNHKTNETSIEREDRAIQLTADINYHIPLGTCRDLAHSMICHNVYPYCDVAPSLPTPRKLCNKVCQEFLTGKCQGHVSKNSSLYKILVEGCDSREYTGGQSPECIPLSYEAYRNDQVESIEDTGDCVRGDGRGYSGNVYRTQSGALCQSWTHQKPHPHPMLPEMYRSDLDQAHFSCRNPGGVGSRPWCYTNDPAVRWEYCTAIPQCDSCEPYTGIVCNTLEGYASSNVAVTRTKFLQSQEAIENKISTFARSILLLQPQPTEGCKDILRVLLCQGAFPQCTETATKRLCSDYCQFIKTLREHCPNVFEEFSEFVAVNGHFMNTPDCTVENGDQCMAVTTMRQPTGNNLDFEYSKNDNCYDKTGLSYNGTVSVTRNGLTCQPWNHSHPITPERYPELIDAQNYCRNPGNLKERPWCLTTDSNWDYCDISQCTSLVDVSKNENNPSSNDGPSLLNQPEAGGSNSSPIVATMSVLVFILLVLMGVAFTGCYFFLSRKNKRAKAMLETEFRLSKMTKEAFEGEKYVTNTDYTKVNTGGNRPQSLVIPENFTLLDGKNIKYVSQLGQGNFGIVFKGRAFDLKKGGEDGEEEGIDVAVKMLKEEATSEVKQDFIDEAKLMFTFDHPNILKIHGVCMSEMPYQLVFEYMDEGDLTKFLRSRASSQQRRLINPFSYRSRTESSYSDDAASLTKTELLYICKQIAAGMNYLSENNHVHRDLACRNCLIKSDLVVKIGDFGMSRNLYSKDYYRINGKAVLPVRWMSPESLIYGKFSIEADVWSFGVVMWEVFSFALQPYYGITNEEVTEAIRKGKTLNRPDDCPIEIYRLMKECWAMDPADRITFPELGNSLSALHQMASMCGSSFGEKFSDDEDAFSDTSDMPSDAFYSEEHLDDLSNKLEQDL